MKLATAEARQFMAGFWEAAEYAYDEMIVCDVAVAGTEEHPLIEVTAKFPDAEVAHIVTVRLWEGETMRERGGHAGYGLLCWIREARDAPRTREKIAAWEAAGRKLEFRVAPFMGRRA